MKKLLVAVAILFCAGTALAQSPSGGAAAGNVDVENITPQLLAEGDRPYVYAVKMLCGTIPAINKFRQFPAPNADELLVPGTYLSMLNVMNPGPTISISRGGGVEVAAIRPRVGDLGSCQAWTKKSSPSSTASTFSRHFHPGRPPRHRLRSSSSRRGS